MERCGMLAKQVLSTVPESDVFMPLGLDFSEKQTPQVVEKDEKPKEQMEGLESSGVLRRHMPEQAWRNRVLWKKVHGRTDLGCFLAYR